MRLIWNNQTVSMRTSSMELPLVSICPLPPYNSLIITRMLVLAIPLAVTTLAFAQPDFITDKSFIIQGGDLVWGKRNTLLQRTEEHPGTLTRCKRPVHAKKQATRSKAHRPKTEWNPKPR